nr:hypothetical protein Cbor_543 [Cedratvirus borely]
MVTFALKRTLFTKLAQGNLCSQGYSLYQTNPPLPLLCRECSLQSKLSYHCSLENTLYRVNPGYSIVLCREPLTLTRMIFSTKVIQGTKLTWITFVL